MDTINLEKNKINRLYFDKVLNSDIKAFLTEAILFAFGSNFSFYWENVIYCTEKAEMEIIFRDYKKEHHLKSMHETYAHIEATLPPASRLECFDISKITKSINLFEKEAAEDPRRRENFDAFCKFYGIAAPQEFSAALSALCRTRNSTTGHPSDKNVLKSCTAENFSECIDGCRTIVNVICAKKQTAKMAAMREDMLPRWQHMLVKANCRPYGLYKTKELSDYKLGTIRGFLQDKHFGAQLNHIEYNGDIIFLDMPVSELVECIEKYLRTQKPEKVQKVPAPAPRPAPAPATAPRRRRVSRWFALLVLLIPLTIFVMIFGLIFKAFSSVFSWGGISAVDKNTSLSLNADDNSSSHENLLSAGTTTTVATAAPDAPHISGKAGLYDVFYISVDQVQSETITFYMENYSVYPCELGWVSGATCYVTTDQGTYVETVNDTIDSATAKEIPVTFEGLKGTIETITFENVNPLNSRGLPVNNNGDSLTIHITTED